MRILGVDPSITSTGLAILDAGQPAWRYSWGIDGHKTDTTVIRNRNLRTVANHVRRVLEPLEFDFAVIEGRAHGARYGNPGEREALRQGIISALDVRKIPMGFVNPTTRALWATGNGRAEKSEVLAAVKSWWPGAYVANHDEADAFVLAAFGAMKHGDPLPFLVKDRHRKGIEITEWPVMA